MVQLSSIHLLFIARVLGGRISYCERPWPTLELFVPVSLLTRPLQFEFDRFFLRSFVLFWPLESSNVSLTVAIDAELNKTKQAAELNATLKDVFIPGGLKLTLLSESPYYRKGYDRQQLVMFWADNFTEREYIGFVDTDTAFSTYIDREDLFEDGKPVVNGKSGIMRGDHPSYLWTIGTYRTLGILEPFRCMSYFPVIIKTSHLKDIREFIANRFNLTFDEAFYHNISTAEKSSYSQFHIMCTYLFTFKRDEYTWYVHSETPHWDGTTPAPLPFQDGNLSQFTANMRLPKPRVATHVRHRSKKNMVRAFPALSRLYYCTYCSCRIAAAFFLNGI